MKFDPHRWCQIEIQMAVWLQLLDGMGVLLTRELTTILTGFSSSSGVSRRPYWLKQNVLTYKLGLWPLIRSLECLIEQIICRHINMFLTEHTLILFSLLRLHLLLVAQVLVVTGLIELFAVDIRHIVFISIQRRRPLPIFYNVLHNWLASFWLVLPLVRPFLVLLPLLNKAGLSLVHFW